MKIINVYWRCSSLILIDVSSERLCRRLIRHIIIYDCVFRVQFFFVGCSLFSLSLSSNLYHPLAHFCRVKLIIWLFLCCLYYLFIPPHHISFVHFCTHFSVVLCFYTSMHFKWMYDANNNNNTELNHNFIPNNYNSYNSSSSCRFVWRKKSIDFSKYIYIFWLEVFWESFVYTIANCIAIGNDNVTYIFIMFHTVVPYTICVLNVCLFVLSV